MFCYIIKLCAMMMFSLLLRLQIVIFVPECTGQLHQMGLIVVTIKQWLFVLQQPILIGWIKMLHLTNCFMNKLIF